MVFLGYTLGVFLLLSIGRFGWAPLVLPPWALMISAYILFANFRPQPAFEAHNHDSCRLPLRQHAGT
jgi:hypothetical protein